MLTEAKGIWNVPKRRWTVPKRRKAKNQWVVASDNVEC